MEICAIEVDKEGILFYNPKYKSEVMNWDSKNSVDAAASDDGGSHRRYNRQNQEPADCPGHFIGFPLSDMGVWNCGPALICDTDILSGYRIVSFISYACPWGRRYQIVFHDWEYLEYKNFVLLYRVVFFNRCCFISNQIIISQKSDCTS